MTKVTERRLMRLLHGELPPAEARRLEQELDRESVPPQGDQQEELRAAHAQNAEVWNSLELPESKVPADFSASVVAAARKSLHQRAPATTDGELSWSLAPAWARGGATAALLTGVLLGAAFGRGFEAPDADNATAEVTGAEVVLIADADADAVPLSLAEVYWLSLEESGGQLAGDDAAEAVQ